MSTLSWPWIFSNPVTGKLCYEEKEPCVMCPRLPVALMVAHQKLIPAARITSPHTRWFLCFKVLPLSHMPRLALVAAYLLPDIHFGELPNFFPSNPVTAMFWLNQYISLC